MTGEWEPLDPDELLRQLREVRRRPGGILGDLLKNLRSSPERILADEIDERSERTRYLSEAKKRALANFDAELEDPERYPGDLLDHIRRAQRQPHSVLADLAQRVRQPFEPFDVSDPVERRLARLRQIFAKACEDFPRKHRSLIYVIIGVALLRIRREAWRVRTRTEAALSTLGGIAVAAGNTLTAVVLASGLFLGAPPSAASTISYSHALSAVDGRSGANPSRTVGTHRERASSARAVDVRIEVDIDAGTTRASASASAARHGRRFVVDRSINGWLEPAPPVEVTTLFWINCEESMTGRTLCSVIEPTVDLLPPPPDGPDS